MPRYINADELEQTLKNIIARKEKRLNAMSATEDDACYHVELTTYKRFLEFVRKMNGELLLCPFCGGEAELFYVPGDTAYTMGHGVAQCSKCKAKVSCDCGEEEKALIKVSRMWNQRCDT